MTHRHAPSELIAAYAAGTLGEGMRLLVASHLAFCACCRDKAARLEAIGGALFAESATAAPSPSCLDKVLARISGPCAQRALAADRTPYPVPLRLRLPAWELTWSPVLPGLSECRLNGFRTEAVGLVRAQPGTDMRGPECCGRESRLVLAGRLKSGDNIYDRGDLALADPDTPCHPEAIGGEDCVCLVVRPGLGPGPMLA